MKASDASLNLLAMELVRLGETIRHHAPDLADAGGALVGIQRQLAAAEAPSATGDAAGSDPGHSAAAAKTKQPKAAQGRNKAKASDNRKQLLKSLLAEVEQLTLMLVAQEVAADMTTETFREFREATIETATQRRKHLADLAFLHSLLAATQAKAGAADVTSANAAGGATDTSADSNADTSTGAPQSNSALEKTVSVAIAELEDMFARCGGQIITKYSAEDQQYFEISGSGSAMRVLRPAYIATNADGRTMVVSRGAIEGKPA